MNKLTFINHASFMIEGESEILLIDPWYEGYAFFNGWSLIDNQITNDSIINILKKINKKVFIWYSHEHSDHFSISFLKKLKKTDLNVLFLFQKTLDQRVVNFLRTEGFRVEECPDGKATELNKNFKITTWSHEAGDSFCLIQIGKISICNLNDCIVDGFERANKIRSSLLSKTNTIDILFTQFGYANSIGNETDSVMRTNAAKEKLARISIQFSELSPKIIIPFASYVYFCHEENFYLNDAQNSPKIMRESEILSTLQKFIFFMKPSDEIHLTNANKITAELQPISKIAEEHWNALIDKISPIHSKQEIIDKLKIVIAFRKFWRKITLNFLLLPQVLELFGVIKPLKILINDFNEVVEVSYLRGINFEPYSVNWTISMNSAVFEFILKNDFGFNTTTVNGRYRVKNEQSNLIAGKFFSTQEFYKNGYGIFHPWTSTKTFLNLLFKRFSSRWF